MNGCRIVPSRLSIIVMGAQGSGKSTQVEMLAENLGLPSVSTGKIFREKALGTDELSQQIKGYLDKGMIVPDEITLKIIKGKLSEMDKGFVGEGFPRRLSQAEALEGLFSLVFYLQLKDETSLRRLMARRVCRKCGANFNLLTKPPKKGGVCDVCGGALTLRDDDTEELINARLSSYHQETEPVLDYYRGKGILEEIDGEQSIKTIQKEIIACLKKRGLIKDA